MEYTRRAGSKRRQRETGSRSSLQDRGHSSGRAPNSPDGIQCKAERMRCRRCLTINREGRPRASALGRPSCQTVSHHQNHVARLHVRQANSCRRRRCRSSKTKQSFRLPRAFRITYGWKRKEAARRSLRTQELRSEPHSLGSKFRVCSSPCSYKTRRVHLHT